MRSIAKGTPSFVAASWKLSVHWQRCVSFAIVIHMKTTQASEKRTINLLVPSVLARIYGIVQRTCSHLSHRYVQKCRSKHKHMQYMSLIPSWSPEISLFTLGVECGPRRDLFDSSARHAYKYCKLLTACFKIQNGKFYIVRGKATIVRMCNILKLHIFPVVQTMY